MTERLTPADAAFLRIEDEVHHTHLATLAVFEGPAPSYEDVLGEVEARLALAPRYRQRVQFVPADIQRPVWVDDNHFRLRYHVRQHFRLRYHVRHTALAPPGDAAKLRSLVGRLQSQKLDRSKPLWELWLIEGMDSGHWALLSKAHHSMVDGISGTDLLSVLVRPTPEHNPAVNGDWQPRPVPSSRQLITDALAYTLSNPVEQWRIARSTWRRFRRPRSRPAVIGPHRRWAWATATLEDARQIRSALGGTVHDVVLAAVASGFHAIGATEPFRALVPLAIDAEGGGPHNITPLHTDLPVGIDDPFKRYEQLTRDPSASSAGVAGQVLRSVSAFALPMYLSMGTRSAIRNAGGCDTVVTNVPGPQEPVFAFERPMVDAYPVVPLVGDVPIGVGVYSYAGRLQFGVTADADFARLDVDAIRDGIVKGFDDLL